MAEPGATGPAGMDIRRILLIAGVSTILIIAAIFFVFRSCGTLTSRGGGNVTIYTHLELKDAANVIVRLKEINIPYTITDSGRSIAVPKEFADQARLGLAEKNLPAGGVVGWEIFDETRLGATDFDRRIQLIRAISGELSRTIKRIDAVDEVRVQIVIPETRLFATNVAPVTASVMLRIRPGFELTPEKITGIIHLVASSVENLQTENVTVIDDRGNILSHQFGLFTTEVPELPTVAEETVVPPTTATPQVETQEVTAETVVETPPPVMSDEEKLLLKVKANKERERNLSGKAQEILNRFYPLNTVLTKVNVDMDTEIITAVVLIDNRVEVSAELKQSTYKAVAAAVGYNRKRGDKIVLQIVPFHLAASPMPQLMEEEIQDMESKSTTEAKPLPAQKPFEWRQYIPWTIGILSVLLVILIAVRLFQGRVKQEQNIPAPMAPPMPNRPPVNRENASILENVQSAAQQNPERIAEMLKNWLSEK
ncbi:MAG: flagellar basal-body MS-ring/collar protein FliF [bacterium]